MNTYAELMKYINGSKAAYNMFSSASKPMIRFAAEIFALGFMVAIYGDMGISWIVMSSVLFIGIVITALIINNRYARMHNAFISKYEVIAKSDDDAEEIVEHERCLQDTKQVLRVGRLAAMVNFITIGLSFVLLIFTFVILFVK